MVTFRQSAVQAGEAYNPDSQTYAKDKTAVAITKGKLLHINTTSNAYELCPTTGTGPGFSVAAKDALAADPKVFVYEDDGDLVALQTTTTLDPTDRVKPSTTVAGAVERFVEGTDVADTKLVGDYIGRQSNINQDTGGQFATGQAAANAWVVVKLGRH